MKQRYMIREDDGADLGAWHPVVAAQPGVRTVVREAPDRTPDGKTVRSAPETLRVEGEVVRDQYNQVVASGARLTHDEEGKAAVMPDNVAPIVVPPPLPPAVLRGTVLPPETTTENAACPDLPAAPGIPANATAAELKAYAEAHGIPVNRLRSAAKLRQCIQAALDRASNQ